MHRSTLTDRWQTTIPAAVRKALRLRPRQGLVYEIHGQTVTIRPEGESLMDLADSLKTRRRPMSKEKARKISRRP